MVKVKSSKKNNLTQSLDTKLSNLIYKLLDEKTEENKRTNTEENKDEFANIALAKDLRTGEILLYCQQKDLSLQRVKKVVLEKTLDRVLKDIRAEEAIEIQNIKGDDPEENLPSDFDDVNVDDLMDVKDQNTLNKSVVNLWNTKTESNETPNETEKEEPENQMIEEVDGSSKEIKKSKKRSKDSSRPSKRQKGKSNFPCFCFFNSCTIAD